MNECSGTSVAPRGQCEVESEVGNRTAHMADRGVEEAESDGVDEPGVAGEQHRAGHQELDPANVRLGFEDRRSLVAHEGILPVRPGSWKEWILRRRRKNRTGTRDLGFRCSSGRASVFRPASQRRLDPRPR
jgi:hypothetical protein